MMSWRMIRFAAYLACSWTWCIGMFLPVLMVRDYGIWAFVVFAVPNVIGAAAFGWVLRKPGASEALVARHGRAMAAFSEVTLAFHAFFVMYLALMFGAFEMVMLVALWFVGMVVFDVGVGLATGLSRHDRKPIKTLLLSLGMFAIAANIGVLDPTAFGVNHWRGPDPALLWLAPVCVFGFMLCPYLDLTFHRARQQCEGTEGTCAFVVGFGVLFLTMILLTLGYGSLFDPPAFSELGWIVLLTTVLPITMHMIEQTVITCKEHFACLSGSRPERFIANPIRLRDPVRLGDVVWIVAAVGLVAIGVLIRSDITYAGLGLGEVGYRCFMGFYGLMFPAYVWLLMVPTRDGHAGGAGPIGKGKLRVFWLAIGIAAPMFWMGFIERSEVWLGPGVMVVLLARLALPRGER